MAKTALRNARVFDGLGLTEPRTVVIDGPVLGTDPAGAREIDVAGATLLPGFIDAHVHLERPEQLADLAAWGVTTGLDMACWPADRVAALRAAGPADFRSAGPPAIGPGGMHVRIPGMPDSSIVTTAEAAAEFVEARVAEGVDYVKGVAEAPGDGGPPAEALQALVDAARRRGLATVVHAATPGAYHLAVATGARFVTHVPLAGRIAAGDVAAMKAAGQTAIPTLTMMEAALPRFAGTTGDFVANAAALHAARIEILAGTDANGNPGAPAEIAHGPSLHHEFELLAEAGLSTLEILRAATVATAQAFGLTDRGEIRPGLRADLVLVEGDPLADLSATRSIRAVWCAGKEIDR
ncbi:MULTISPECIES: amidohydrolase family protein [Amycolatopsis]|uniref:amidohydrolase family protein n=1 Tax=Amycolatopsis TaxID=1813 RepID=UPI0007DF5E63|nr:amidohydrolase family protein [Amycolatopsis sp. M39]OAP25714.1 Imidazolonepropionase [Amycolatopsis sp. M39]